MPPKDEVRIRHMLDAARKAIAFCRGKSRAHLDSDEMLKLALVRLIEVIGEAARAISPETQALAPEVPWRQITGTRDRLIHGYADVDPDIVWSIVTEDLPAMVASLEKLAEPKGP